MAKPFVTVVINTINEDFTNLSREIRGYLNQQDVRVQLIVSTVEGDKSIEYITTHFPDVELAIMPRRSHPIFTGDKCPRGSFLQLNNGLKLMRGDWFVFASGNDFVYPFKLKAEVECALANNKEVCYSAYDYTDATGKKLKYVGFHEYDYARHMHGNFVSDCSVISKRLVDKYLPFRTELNNYAYWDLWLRIYEGEGNLFCYNPVATWGYAQADTSMHIQRWKSPEQMRLAEQDKERMLALHRVRTAKLPRVLNITMEDHANFAYENMKALRSIGIDANCVKTAEHPFHYPEQARCMLPKNIIQEMKKYDIIQYFFKKNLWPVLRPHLNGHKLVVYYASSDFRDNKEEYLREFNRVAHKSVIALGEFANLGAKNEVYVVGAVDTDKLKPMRQTVRKPYRFGHYPSNPDIKGTPTIQRVVNRIGNLNFRCETNRVDFDEQQARMQWCDVYIELFSPTLRGNKYGSFGISALEAAAMGKIVITQNLSADIYKQNYGECPLILVSDEDDLQFKIELINSMRPSEIMWLQNKTREWVVRNHSYQATGMRILNHVL